MPDVAAFKRLGAMRAHRVFRLARKGCECVRVCQPMGDLVLPSERCVRQVNFGEQTVIVAVAHISPRLVEMCQFDGCERKARLQCSVRLNSDVVLVIRLLLG